MIPIGSLYEQAVADFFEDGYGTTRTHLCLNLYRKMEGLKPIGRSSVHECQKRLKPQKKEIKKRSQGSNDPESNWCQAGFLLAKQMCIRLNHIGSTDEDPPMPTKMMQRK